jgi:hypothetical protein
MCVRYKNIKKERALKTYRKAMNVSDEVNNLASEPPHFTVMKFCGPQLRSTVGTENVKAVIWLGVC